jgi:site-specific recombinase XerD
MKKKCLRFTMSNEDSRMLMDSILDYMRWVKSVEDHRGTPSHLRYTRILMDFLIYVIHKDIAWDEMFTIETLEAFQTYSGYKAASRALRALSDYLFTQGRIDQPLKVSKPQTPLPDIYEQYLIYHAQSREVSPGQLRTLRRILGLFHEYLQRDNIKLAVLKIDHLDAFMATFKVSENTRRTYRHYLRGFLKYLYHEQRIIKTDLAPLVVGAPLFAQAKPPKFLRPQELQKLFSNLELTTPVHIRTYAMVHLAYYMGLRPKEISKIKLKDVSFKKKELTLRERKANNPTILPLPEKTIKAIAAYRLYARPNSKYEYLFLSFHSPHRPIKSVTVTNYISKAIKQAGLLSPPYSLRHAYAQSLLNTGATIYEIKEMLGHENIQSTKRYITIDIELMRKVLFDEEL